MLVRFNLWSKLYEHGDEINLRNWFIIGDRATRAVDTQLFDEFIVFKLTEICKSFSQLSKIQ